MSVNAKNAYDSGEMPISKWTKSDIISAIESVSDIDTGKLNKLTLKELQDNFLVNSSWHHTGMYYNQTDFYQLDEEYAENVTDNDIDEIITSRKDIPRTKKTEAEKQAIKNNKDALSQAQDIYKKLNLIYKSGITKLASEKGVINRYLNGKMDIDQVYDVAINTLYENDRQKVEQWKRLPEGHARHKDVQLYNADKEAYIMEMYGDDMTSPNSKLVQSIKKNILDNSNVSYSLKNQSDILKENKELREANEGLRRQFELTKVAKVDNKKLTSFAKSILREYDSRADVDEISPKLDELFTYMANGDETGTVAWDEVRKKAVDVANVILEESVAINDELYQEYSDLRKYLKSTAISIDKSMEGELIGYDSINEFRKANFGRLKITKDGVPVDVLFKELSETYPEYFDENEHMTQADQLARIEEVLDSFKPFEFNPYEGVMGNASSWMAYCYQFCKYHDVEFV